MLRGYLQKLLTVGELESRLSKHTVRSVTSGQEDNWLRIYNSSIALPSECAPLSARDIDSLAQNRLLSLENLLVAYRGRTPSAACRLVIDPASSSVLMCDLGSLPGRPEGARDLIDHVITQAREMRIARVGVWVDGSSESLANLVSSFSFDVRRVRVRMDCTMMSAPERTAASPTSRFSHLTDGRPLSESDLEGRTTMHDLIEYNEMMWRESERLTTGQAVVSAYTSEKSRTTAWMLTRGQNPANQDTFNIEERDLLALMTRLYERRVRHIRAETVPEYAVRRVFSSVGFEPKKSCFLLGLELLY